MKKLYISLAETEEKRSEGLMWRKKIGKNEGMLFVFPYENILSFWMKNTYIPLDIAFLDNDFVIIQIEKMVPLSTKKISSSKKCKYALEVPHGWFKENNICTGKKLKISDDFFKKINFKFAQTKDPDIDAPLIDDEVPENLEKYLENDTNENDSESESNNVNNSIDKIDKHSPTEVENEDLNVELSRNKRDVIKKAEIDGNEIELIYWTLSGHILPPRKIKPHMGKYLIKNGPHGDYLVAFDFSPTISGGGWSIKGNQPKSFLIDNIVKMDLIPKEKNVAESTYEKTESKRQNFWEKLKNIF